MTGSRTTEPDADAELEITSENLVRHEIIGLGCEVHDSDDEGLVDVSGVVVGETTHTVEIDTSSDPDEALDAVDEDAVKQVPKSVCTFDFVLPDGEVVRVDGEVIDEEPAERTRMKA
ncbi:MAG: ribonuclease P protein subunit [Halobacteria archaeon]|nr:ribonuclease P protein subunit [Halobacteria archaeon]